MEILQTCQELSFLVQLLKDLLSIDLKPVHIYNDNQGAIPQVKNTVKHQKSKPTDICYHYIIYYHYRDICILLWFLCFSESS